MPVFSGQSDFPALTMDAIDVDWCLHCDRKTDQNGYFCSDQCRDLHEQQQAHLLDARSRSSSPSLSDLSDLDLAAPPSQALQDGLHAEDWVGRGSDGIHAWAATVPLGAPPSSVASSPTLPGPSPPPLRTRKSTSSARSSTSSHRRRASRELAQPVASSSTLRPSLPPSLSSRKPAPPRLFLHSSSPSQHHTHVCRSASPDHDASACSPYTSSCTALPHVSFLSVSPPLSRTPASPTQPILNPRVSLPSLTAQSATASLSSLATPHTASRPPSRPQSRPSSFHPSSRPGSHPASRAVSVADGDAEKEEEEDEEPHHAARKNWIRSAVHKFSSAVGHWAAGDYGGVGHVPYSIRHDIPAPYRRQSQQQARDEHLARAAVPPPSTPLPPTPELSASQATPQPQYVPSEPIPRVPADTPAPPRAQSPRSVYAMQGDFARPPPSFFDMPRKAKKAPPTQPHAVRMGRGLLPPRVASRVNVAEHFAVPHSPEAAHEHAAWKARGRRSQRAERKFVPTTTQVREVEAQ